MNLNKTIREKIVSDAIAAAFDKRKAKHDKDRKRLADAIYTHEHGAAEKIASKLPRDWQQTVGDFFLTHAGFSYQASSPNTADNHLRLSGLRLGPKAWGNMTIKVGKDHAMYAAADELARNEVQLNADIAALRDKLTRIVSSANTVKRLREIWPEGAKFFPAETGATTAMIPTELVAEVNATMGLR